MSEDLPGGVDQDEIAAMRRLQKELASDGYRVGKVAITAGGEPVALVYLGKSGDPLLRILIGARSILRVVSEIDEPMVVSAEEFETLQALRTTSAVLARTVDVRPSESVGDVAREAFGRQALAGADMEEK